ncbi:GNAT superfamily N-acetyltransferase [Angulomicrobium tetraedrale]|uniref:GNAT superfamily N-acetyltransferase n=1 Tax=Ancylobacter tetraedralis TaxID=217068 RepID=A0A839ZCE1_9HYPH|nr:GNAT family N-acetyltransferase [Ancylobacter tetraedralis]MBB3772451.1 GNAT superfamily N-acetyltransferase [Ancylobacter tetraedralis]
MSLVIREARPDEAGLIVDFICELAEYEKLRHEVVASIGDIERDLFGPNPRVFCDIAEWDGAPAGLALWFYNYSTFRGRHGIYLEDLYVRPAFRGQGIAKGLMARLARRCVDEGLGRFEWWVLNWNEPAIRFYRSIGAVPMDEWTVQRVTGAALDALAQG